MAVMQHVIRVIAMPLNGISGLGLPLNPLPPLLPAPAAAIAVIALALVMSALHVAYWPQQPASADVLVCRPMCCCRT